MAVKLLCLYLLLVSVWSTWADEQSDERCRQVPNGPVCSGVGECVEGDCECPRHRLEDNKRYTGMFCECDNFSCERSDNKLCGGHGECVCGQCRCHPTWTGEACDCSLNTSSCLATNQQVCNGRGSCLCGTCRCTGPKFQGPTCEECPRCRVCEQQRDCVECRAYGTGRMKDLCDEECGYFSLYLVDKEANLPVADIRPLGYTGEPVYQCKERESVGGCWMVFQYSKLSGGQAHVDATAKQCPPVVGSIWEHLGDYIYKMLIS